MEELIKELVEGEYEKLDLDQRQRLTPEMKRVMLVSVCKTQAFNNWGLGTPDVWSLMEEKVRELIPDEDGSDQ